LALASDQTVGGRGYNVNGEVGNGTTTSPILVTTQTCAAGQTSTCTCTPAFAGPKVCPVVVAVGAELDRGVQGVSQRPPGVRLVPGPSGGAAPDSRSAP
jgi:hypothetical protein